MSIYQQYSDPFIYFAQLAGAVEYTDYTYAKG